MRLRITNMNQSAIPRKWPYTKDGLGVEGNWNLATFKQSGQPIHIPHNCLGSWNFVACCDYAEDARGEAGLLGYCLEFFVELTTSMWIWAIKDQNVSVVTMFSPSWYLSDISESGGEIFPAVQNWHLDHQPFEFCWNFLTSCVCVGVTYRKKTVASLAAEST